MNAQENYEQLKRRNRRRLVGALIMVVIAAILLLIMLNRRTPQPVPAPQLDIQAASAVVLEPVDNVPTSAVTVPAAGVNTMPAASAVSEHESDSIISRPVPLSQTTVQHSKPAETVTPNEAPATTPARAQARQQNDVISANTRPSVHPSKPAAERAVTSEPADKKNIETNRQHNTQTAPDSRTKAAIAKPAGTVEKNAPVQVPTATNSQARTEAAAKPARKAPAATTSGKNSEAVSTAGTATAPKTINKTPATAKPATPAKNTTGATNSTAAGRLTPQQILENKAAVAMTKKTVSNQNSTSATSTNTSNVAVERTVIQIGAYTTEAQANLVQQRLAVAGVPTSISASQTSKGTLYRVRSRVYNSRSQAMQNLDKVRAVGLDGLVIGL
ncbi:SPOR domain-containing protein [Snodgrassella gandavensis]|uniref:SPOR domain-containing protein n=1 Tax=Snodgrassella gandavensis TaxID=2946698 RepID=UPI001EF59002|nr:SPOR domain-containing protein [Snodgrassella gandavensis]